MINTQLNVYATLNGFKVIKKYNKAENQTSSFCGVALIWWILLFIETYLNIQRNETDKGKDTIW